MHFKRLLLLSWVTLWTLGTLRAQYAYRGQIGNNDEIGLPFNSTTDSEGNVYVTDAGKYRIMKFSPDGRLLLKFGAPGSGDGQFYSPYGVALDDQGNIYVADGSNNRIQKFSPEGYFLFKFGSRGTGDGQFSMAKDVAVDHQGNVYVADQTNNRIQKFSPDGQFLLGFGTFGYEAGQFVSVNDIAVDGQGNVYASDRSKPYVQKFSPTGRLLALINTPGLADAIALDGQGNVYVTEFSRTYTYIHKISPAGQLLFKFGSYGKGDGQMIFPSGISVDAQGNVFVSDQGNHRLQKFSPTGQFLWQAGHVPANGQFWGPRGIASDKDGNLYVADQNHNRIQVFSAGGQFLSKFGSYGSGDGQFSGPSSVAVDAQGNLFVVDEGNNRVQKFSPAGQFLLQFGSFGTDDGQFNRAVAADVDAAGNVYVTDQENHRIQKFSPDGRFLAKFGGNGHGDGQLYYPASVAIDPVGNVYVTDNGNGRVQKFSPDGQYLFAFGSPESEPGQLQSPFGIALDDQGNLYVTDLRTHAVHQFTATGQFLAKIGSPGEGDGQLRDPLDLVIDRQGNLAVVDRGNSRVQLFGATPEVAVSVGGQAIGNNTSFFNFGTTSCGTPVDTVFTVDNTGGLHALTLSGLMLPAGFALVGNFPGRVDIGASATFRVRLLAAAAGDYEGVLLFTTNDPDEDPYNFVIGGVVTRGSQTVAFEGPEDKTFADGPVQLAAAATSGLPVQFNLISGPATLDGSTLHLTGVGTVRVSATQPGNANYFAAPAVERTIAISKGDQRLAFEPVADQILGGPSVPLRATATSQLPVFFAVVSGPAAVAEGILTFTNYGAVTVRASQDGNENFNAASPVERTFYVFPAEPAITVKGDTLYSNSPVGNQWLLNNEEIAGATDPFYVVTATGTYTVRVAGPYISSRTAVPVTITISGTEARLHDDILLFPNPSRQTVALRLPPHLVARSVQLYNAQGSLIRVWKGSGAATLDVSTLAKGWYVVQIQTREGSVHKKLLVQ